MKLFLASLANQSLELVRPLLPADPNTLKVAFIPTAADTYDDKPWVADDRNKLRAMGFAVTDYDIKDKNIKTLLADLAEFDVIHITGGNTYYLLWQVKQSGFDKAILQLLDQGKLYIGSSAGSCIMCPTIAHVELVEHKELVPEITDYTGLGLVDELIVPHYGRAKYADRHIKIREEWGDKVAFLTDDQAVIVNGAKKYIVTNEVTHGQDGQTE